MQGVFSKEDLDDKKFALKGYVDARFDTDPDDSKAQSGYILKVGAIS